MRIIPRYIPLALLGLSIASCATVNKPTRFARLKAPVTSFAAASEQLRVDVREYLKEEDRWTPKGRDISLWNATEMLWASGHSLRENLAKSKLTPKELSSSLGLANSRLNDLAYWTANVRTSEAIQRSVKNIRVTLHTLQSDSRAAGEKAPLKASPPSKPTSFFAAPEPFSPNDLNGAVSIAKSYLATKYGIKNEEFGNMKAREFPKHHEVTLETVRTGYLLLVDIRKGTVFKEKSYPKSGRQTASR